MLFWAVDNPAPGNYLLISGDRDFSNALHQLRMRKYNILLAQPQKASASLVAAAKSVWLWTSLLAGGPPLTKGELHASVSEPLQMLDNGYGSPFYPELPKSSRTTDIKPKGQSIRKNNSQPVGILENQIHSNSHQPVGILEIAEGLIKGGKLFKIGKTVKCGKYKQERHNSRSCKGQQQTVSGIGKKGATQKGKKKVGSAASSKTNEESSAAGPSTDVSAQGGKKKVGSTSGGKKKVGSTSGVKKKVGSAAASCPVAGGSGTSEKNKNKRKVGQAAVGNSVSVGKKNGDAGSSGKSGAGGRRKAKGKSK